MYYEYVRLLVVGGPLVSFYDWGIVPPAFSPDRWQIFVGLGLLLATLGLALHWARTGRRRLLFLVAAALIGLAPYAHLVHMFDIMGERFLLIPSAFVCGLAALGLVRLWTAAGRSWLRPVLAAALLLLMAHYAARTVIRNAEWRSDRTALEAAVRDFPASLSAHIALGDSYIDEGDRAGALPHFEHAAALVPVFATPVEKALGCIEGVSGERWLERYEAAGGVLTPAMRAWRAGASSLGE